MKTYLADVVPIDMYDAAVKDGHIRVRPHSDEPYLIHNYTEACVWESGWNPATLACRGLITHADTGEVLARPFPKFFNFNQPEAAHFHSSSPVVVTEKMDGSLGILYSHRDGTPAVSTRGSFHSTQAHWATNHYRRQHRDFTPNPDFTYLFEIIYPDNRIVLEYDFEGLILLGAIHVATGRTVPLEEASAGWDGAVVDVHPYASLADVLASGERDDKEGFVVHDVVTDERVKVKHSTYMRLHKLLTNTNERAVWDVLASGEQPAAVFASAPDEFHQWLRIIEHKLHRHHYDLLHAAHQDYDGIVGDLDNSYGAGNWTRKQFAEQAVMTDHAGWMFTLLDGNDLSPTIWQFIKPVGETTTFRVVKEDTN